MPQWATSDGTPWPWAPPGRRLTCPGWTVDVAHKHLGKNCQYCQSAGCHDCHDNLRCFRVSACNFGTSNACCMMQHDKHLIASKSGNSHPNAIKSPDKARFSWPPTMKSSHCTGQCTQTTQKNRCQRWMLLRCDLRDRCSNHQCINDDGRGTHAHEDKERDIHTV